MANVISPPVRVFSGMGVLKGMVTIREVFSQCAPFVLTQPSGMATVGGDRGIVLMGHVFERVSNLMDDALLDISVGKDGGDRLTESGQVVDGHHEDILDTPPLEFG